MTDQISKADIEAALAEGKRQISEHWGWFLTLGLVLIGHCPLRGVVELLRDLLDYKISLGSVFNIVRAAIEPARRHNQAQDLGRVRVA